MTGNGHLQGKTIVLGVTGSIAAVETVKLCHELRRQGAAVQTVMSEAACGIINPEALTYATGRPVITACTGLVEHVGYCGEGGQGDLLLIAPCTANTLGKIAAGIDDTVVTTFATTAIGRGMPVIIAPAMHESMYRHPAVKNNILKLESWGITVIPPRIEEQRAKIAGIDEILHYTMRGAGGWALKGKCVLVTSGACREPLDDVRILTTRATGMMGRAVALEAFRLGADVTVVHQDTFPCIRNIAASSAEEMTAAVLDFCRKNRVDFYISAAAISDFSPDRVPGKIPSGKEIPLLLRPLPKLLPAVAATCRERPVIVAFKMGFDEEKKAGQMISRGVAMVIVNTPEAMGSNKGKFVIITRDRREELVSSKENLAGELWKKLL
ncbi:MAG TPA: bifunctional phosphopantothenoylcysteine decarboxylase/phosphopantothenate--cysteine ligase CoaBC [Methanoregulaceae archaeon]|nr:bifunctional phosphopantothenoylcysteine decarboxylase/phosphopantothenate--cysteine ligase CoaBC [Methanoregulaceae archaeon]